MKRSLILTFQYYRVLLVYNITFTVLGIFLCLMGIGTIDVEVLLFGKIIGFLGAVGLNYYSAKGSYFYFRNAGYGMRQIINYAFIVDILFNLVIVTLFILTKNGLNPQS